MQGPIRRHLKKRPDPALDGCASFEKLVGHTKKWQKRAIQPCMHKKYIGTVVHKKHKYAYNDEKRLNSPDVALKPS
jgi:hypothetical protein